MALGTHREKLSAALEGVRRVARDKLAKVREDFAEESAEMSKLHRAARRAWMAKPSPQKVKAERPAAPASTTTIVTQAATAQPPPYRPQTQPHYYNPYAHLPHSLAHFGALGYPTNYYARPRPPYG